MLQYCYIVRWTSGQKETQYFDTKQAADTWLKETISFNSRYNIFIYDYQEGWIEI